MPIAQFHGLLGGFSAFKNHVSFGLAFVLDSNICKSLEAKGYRTGKKTIQIHFDQTVPSIEIIQILKSKAKENETKQK